MYTEWGLFMKKTLLATSILSLLSLNAVSIGSAEEPVDLTNSVQARGTEKLWSAGKVISSKTVTGKWTFTSWSDKVKQ